jgi:hypothetical protein
MTAPDITTTEFNHVTLSLPDMLDKGICYTMLEDGADFFIGD